MPGPSSSTVSRAPASSPARAAVERDADLAAGAAVADGVLDEVVGQQPQPELPAAIATGASGAAA